jgi:hypothetical protein
MPDHVATARSRALVLLERTQELQALTRRRELLHRLVPHLPQFTDGLRAALGDAADVQRDVANGTYADPEEAQADLALAVTRVEAYARLVRAAAALTENTIALRDRRLLAAVQRVTSPLTFRDAVLDRLHGLHQNESRRQVERAHAEAARLEALAQLFELKKALAPESPAAVAPSSEESIEDKIATNTATPEELDMYRRRRP